MAAPGGRRSVVAWIAVAAVLCAACGGTSTAPPAQASGPAGAQVAAATGTPAESVGAGAPSAATSSAAAAQNPGPPQSAGPASSGPAASPTVRPLPSPGRARAFDCASLATAQQVTKATGVQQFLMDLSNMPPGVTLPKLPKGETECKYIGQGKKGSQAIIVVVDLTILTDGSRSSFDQQWKSTRGTPLVASLSGVGDDAAWMASQDTLAGIKGPTAFVITLEPTPVTFYTKPGALAAAVAIARAVLPDL